MVELSTHIERKQRMNIPFAIEAKVALAKTTPLQRFLMSQRGKKLYLGDEQRTGWLGKLPFYLFLCKDCGHHAKDYPHGHIERQYLLCSHCGAHQYFIPWWVVENVSFCYEKYLQKKVIRHEDK